MKPKQAILALSALTIILLSLAIVGFKALLVGLTLPLIYFFVEEYSWKLKMFEKLSTQIEFLGIFVLIAALVSLITMITFIFYLIFWAIVIHLWFNI